MKKLLLQLALLFIPFFLFLFWWEINLRMMPNSYSVKKKLAEKAAPDTEVLILGTSHEYHGINPRYFNYKAFNFAYDSQSLYFDKLLLEKYLPTFKNLKVVILGTSYFSYEYVILSSNEDWRNYFYYKIYGLPPEHEKNSWDPRKISMIALYQKDFAINYIFSGFHNTAVSADKDFEILGGGGSYCGPDNYGSRARFHTSIMDEKYILENFKHMDDMLALLNKNNIRAIIVTLPNCRSYYAGMDGIKFARMQKINKELSDKYHIPYVNLLGDPRFTDGDFIDGDHLNPYGVKKASDILNQKVNEML